MVYINQVDSTIRDRAPQQIRSSAAYIERMSDVTITALENGPLQVDGESTVLASDGTVVKEAAKIFLCRCGHSANKPMCDGSHKREGFVAS